jgi:hypothetical protein
MVIVFTLQPVPVAHGSYLMPFIGPGNAPVITMIINTDQRFGTETYSSWFNGTFTTARK